MNGKSFIINSDLIEKVEETPDTVITLTNDKKIVVKESGADIVDKVIEYKRKIQRSIACSVETE
ncbi:flagellar protein [Caldisalinibacter kiritimatiensis]|uniref:Flagellar protein n=2 Tax=Caldisalinibacter kiritimatiensis TaxID=1304284 RepID=R1ASS2_9FIRM|nr:flagellar protein [Caldisalinibacter kiritimatiensis]